MIDVKLLDIERIRSALQHAWYLKGDFAIIGNVDHAYYIWFAEDHDREYVLLHGPWSVDNSLMEMRPWFNDMFLDEHQPIKVPLWMHIWGLPPNYFTATTGQVLGNLLGEFRKFDFMASSYNVRFLRIQVLVDTSRP
ncbi:hypothetical protein K1719_017906 [Acacia pycnantha]|nr:hypothetical protein K1719_017906 [Acacia pycnantha]